MAYSQVSKHSPSLGRVGPAIAGSTVALTLSLFGLLSLLGPGAPGLGSRVPYYVLGAAAIFASALLAMEGRAGDGRTLLGVAVVIGAVSFVFLGLGVEGILYAARNPAEAFTAQRFFYLLSAALVATGLGYWAANHVEEATRSIRDRRYRR